MSDPQREESHDFSRVEDVNATLVYDDDCGFCTWSAEFAVRHGADVELVGFSELTGDQRARLPEGWESCAHLLADDRVYSCGAAMEEALARTELVPYALVRFLRGLPGYATPREAVYWFIADHRPWFSRLVRR